MVERIIELSVRHKWVGFGAVFALALWAADSVRRTPLDAVPDLSDPQVIIYTEWMGRSPDLVEDQITYPLVRALQEHAWCPHSTRLFDVRHELHLRDLQRGCRHLLGAHTSARELSAFSSESTVFVTADSAQLLDPGELRPGGSKLGTSRWFRH